MEEFLGGEAKDSLNIFSAHVCQICDELVTCVYHLRGPSSPQHLPSGRTPQRSWGFMGNVNLPGCPGSVSESTPSPGDILTKCSDAGSSVRSGAAAVLCSQLSKPLPLSPRPRPARGNPFQLFVFVTSFLWLLHKAHDHRWGWECRSISTVYS